MGSPIRVPPQPSASPTPVRFPPIVRDELASGFRVWSMPWDAVPVVTVALLIEGGAADDPVDRPGLASLAADLADEGAGGRDAVELSAAFDRLGTRLDVEAGHDAISLSFTALSRHFDATLALIADVLIRPHLAERDLARIRELRLGRLRQLKTSASAAADRAFLHGVFGDHPYGHGTLGTSRALEAVTVDEVRAFHQQLFLPQSATLIVAGDVPAAEVTAAARRHFGEWRRAGPRVRAGVPAPAPPPTRCLLVDRPGAPQSELRVGHLGPERRSPSYHALVVLNAALGGQFTSRINQLLREAKGVTYGARTGFEFHRAGSTFTCETSVHPDATVESVADVLAELDAVGTARPVAGEELLRAKASLTRGYVRHFETPAQLVRAAVELLKFDLPDDSFDQYVPSVSSVEEAVMRPTARRYLRPAECVITIVGDAGSLRAKLSALDRPVLDMAPEF